MNYPKLHRDYETRSTVNLQKVGAHVYAQHPSTQLLVAVWIIETSIGEYLPPIIRCRSGDWGDLSFPGNVRLLIENGCTVAGHNAAFEAAMDEYHTSKLGWPAPKLEQLDCTMARAAAQALPLDLDSLCEVLNLRLKKDEDGRRLMLRMCKPRRPRQGENPAGVHWFEDAERMDRLTKYCLADVRAEIEVDHALRPLQDQEREVWLLDQRMNNRGVEIDRAFVDWAEAFVARAIDRANRRMQDVTHGAVSKCSEITKLKSFAKRWNVAFEAQEKVRRSGESYEADMSDREALTDLLEKSDVPGKCNAEWRPGDDPSVRAAFEIRLDAGKTSLTKLTKFRLQAPEGRARGNLQYHAAAPGRWAGRGIQLQNLVRRGIDEKGGWDQAYHDMRTLGDGAFEAVWGSPFDVVSRMMRGAIVAAPGHQLYFADFANVEARGCAWAAGQSDLLKLFANDGPIYETMGATIFGTTIDEVIEGHKTGKNPLPRWYGKTVTLGCGYGMGWRTFQRNAKKTAGLRLPDDMCRTAVGAWRERNPKIVKMWRELERAARVALRNPDTIIRANVIPNEAGAFSYRYVRGRWLQCRLPSGRLIWYRRPSLKPTREHAAVYGPDIPEWNFKLHYWGVNSVTRQWQEETTWGGKLLENAIQGMCSDFLRHALLNLEAARYWPVLSVHDEPIAEVPSDFGSVEEYVKIVSKVPPWARGFPLKATGGRGLRYTKT